MNTRMVEQARKEEIKHFKAHNVYTKVPKGEANGAKAVVIDTRWVVCGN